MKVQTSEDGHTDLTLKFGLAGKIDHAMELTLCKCIKTIEYRVVFHRDDEL